MSNTTKAKRKKERKRRAATMTSPVISDDHIAGVNQRASLRTGDDPILKVVCKSVDCRAITDPKSGISCCIKNMKSVLLRSKDGVGLSANQAGYDDRIILVKALGVIITMINPVVTDHAEEKIAATEGCLPYPGESKRVSRYRWVEVEWVDEYGEERKDIFGRKTSRIIQHELDHLEGMCQVHEFKLESIGVPKWLV